MSHVFNTVGYFLAQCYFVSVVLTVIKRGVAKWSRVNGSSEEVYTKIQNFY